MPATLPILTLFFVVCGTSLGETIGDRPLLAWFFAQSDCADAGSKELRATTSACDNDSLDPEERCTSSNCQQLPEGYLVASGSVTAASWFTWYCDDDSAYLSVYASDQLCKNQISTFTTLSFESGGKCSTTAMLPGKAAEWYCSDGKSSSSSNPAGIIVGSVLVLFGLVLAGCAAAKSTFVVYKVFAAKASGCFGDKKHVFLLCAGLMVVVFGGLLIGGIIPMK